MIKKSGVSTPPVLASATRPAQATRPPFDQSNKRKGFDDDDDQEDDGTRIETENLMV
jgi:hypothetical protein